MISKRLILVLLLASACKPASKPAAGAKPAEPQIRATVVSVRTTLKPSNQAFAHQIVIADGIARNTGERDLWRLFDTGKNTVITIDDVSRTYSTEAVDVLLKRQRAVLRERSPVRLPPLDYQVTKEKRSMFGAVAQQALATSGRYRRELWIARHPAIPPKLFSMMQASMPPSSPLVPLASEVERALLDLDGFPMVDRYELPFGGKEYFGAERVVVGVVERDVPQSVLAIPKGYRDVTPRPPATGARKKKGR